VTAPPDLRLGVHLGQQNLTIDRLRELWRRFDEHLDWLSCWDHLYEAPPAGGTLDHFEPVSLLGAMAVETSRIRLGCLVFYVGYRSPGVLAKAATTIDHLSGGRFELGLGAGWHEQECRAFGYPFPPLATRAAMLDEATTIVRGLLTQDRTTFTGEHFSVDDASCLPAPVQARLPIWIGGTGPKRTLPLVAKHADGWNAAYISPERFGELGRSLDGACERVERDPVEIRRAVNLSFNLSADEAGARRAESALRDQWGEAFGRISGGTLLGTPERAVEQVLAFVEAGATDVNVALRAPWDEAALDAYLDEVVPAVRDAVGVRS
jgi:alkanesulfonate monooxygenase SsuD/methylene tetrahydromethanopterin reductase-like flavin-dependent oxidoreductase (luciferase family)